MTKHTAIMKFANKVISYQAEKSTIQPKTKNRLFRIEAIERVGETARGEEFIVALVRDLDDAMRIKTRSLRLSALHLTARHAMS